MRTKHQKRKIVRVEALTQGAVRIHVCQIYLKLLCENVPYTFFIPLFFYLHCLAYNIVYTYIFLFMFF